MKGAIRNEKIRKMQKEIRFVGVLCSCSFRVSGVLPVSCTQSYELKDMIPLCTTSKIEVCSHNMQDIG